MVKPGVPVHTMPQYYHPNEDCFQSARWTVRTKAKSFSDLRHSDKNRKDKSSTQNIKLKAMVKYYRILCIDKCAVAFFNY